MQHRVDEIRKLAPQECWNHCPGADNPPDLLSRGIDCRQWETSVLWWNGPKWPTSLVGLGIGRRLWRSQSMKPALQK